jgi:hypothetical protein
VRSHQARVTGDGGSYCAFAPPLHRRTRAGTPATMGKVWNTLGYDRTRSYNGALPHSHSGQDYRAGADVGAPLDDHRLNPQVSLDDWHLRRYACVL